MQVCGVICEYNPFHNGHALHLSQARAHSNADYVVCVMSGSVTQRGVFARHDKWSRAHMALAGGADLVLELPVRFACASAKEFAFGGVSLLSALGVVTHLSFGCEETSIPQLPQAAAALADESDAFKRALHRQLDLGMPYPRARALAAQETSGLQNLEALISPPNASLACEYLQALRILAPGITPVPIVREGSGYHDETLSALSSATAVRAAIVRGDLSAALSAVPSPQLLAACEAHSDVHEEEALSQALFYLLRSLPAETLARTAGMAEGLEHLFIRAARTAVSRDELILSIKSKRYTYARLSRICTSILLGVTQDFSLAHAAPTYARVLGFRREAQPLLAAIKKQGRIPLVTKAADYDRTDPLFALDLRAQDLWSLGCSNLDLRQSGRDFTTSPILL